MLLTIPALPAAPWLDWIEGTAFLSYLDPAGRGLFFPSARSFALVKPDVGEGDALASDIAQPDQVIVVGDAVSFVHSTSPSAKVVQTHGQETMEPFADAKFLIAKSANSQGG